MDSTLKITVLCCGIVFCGSVFYLLVKRTLNVRNSFLWIGGSLIVLLLSAMPGLLQLLADATGVDYPPALLFLISILVILLIILRQSIHISILESQVRELTQYVAIHNQHLGLQDQCEYYSRDCEDDKGGV